MPDKVPPSVRRVMNSKLTKKEVDTLPPPLRRVANSVNKAANKYKWEK